MPPRRALLILPFTAVALWLALRWTALPESFATRFDFAGDPSGRTDRASFAVLALGMQAGLAVVFGGLATWTSAIPAAWIRRPDPERPLAPERSSPSLDRLAAFLDGVGLAVTGFLAALFIAIGEHAIAGRARFPPVWHVATVALVIAGVAGAAWLDAPFRARRRASMR